MKRWDFDFVERPIWRKPSEFILVKTCKTCKHIHATKSKTGTLELWMGLVKLVTCVNTFMLQNQRLTKHLYRIDSNTNLYRIILEVLTQQVIFFVFFDAFTCEVLDFVENMNFPCQMFYLWKVLDFVEGNSLPWRAEIDLVKWTQGAWRWGPLQNQGSQHPPPNCKGDELIKFRKMY